MVFKHLIHGEEKRAVLDVLFLVSWNLIAERAKERKKEREKESEREREREI